jgi:dolichol-phosphate mannosyltransferase
LNELITVVIPTLNEEEAIGDVLKELHGLGIRNILVVDGYSSDKTVDIAKQSGARIVFQHGRGKTGAIKTAIETVDTFYMLVIDGDFTYDAACIDRLLRHMKSHDEVIGARLTDGNNMTLLHKLGNKIITKVFNLLMNTNLSDLCSGMYMLKTDSMREINLESTGFAVEAEISAQIASYGSITEVPVNYRPRLGKQKLSTWKHGFKIISSIIGLARTYNPGMFYSLVASLLVIPAGLMLLGALMESALTGRIDTPWFFIGISMLLVSIQAMGVGVVSLILRRTELRTSRTLRRILKEPS